MEIGKEREKLRYNGRWKNKSGREQHLGAAQRWVTIERAGPPFLYNVKVCASSDKNHAQSPGGIRWLFIITLWPRYRSERRWLLLPLQPSPAAKMADTPLRYGSLLPYWLVNSRCQILAPSGLP